MYTSLNLHAKVVCNVRKCSLAAKQILEDIIKQKQQKEKALI